MSRSEPRMKWAGGRKQTDPVRGTICSYISLCGLVDGVHWHFREKYCLHLQPKEQVSMQISVAFLPFTSDAHTTIYSSLFFFLSFRSLNNSDNKNKLAMYSLHPCPLTFLSVVLDLLVLVSHLRSHIYPVLPYFDVHIICVVTHNT
jgi:hypothetical protein